MSASNRRDLFIAVNGNVDKLESAMKLGRTVLLDFGVAAGNVQAEVQKLFSDFGASQLDNSLKQMEASYKGSFKNIRDNARAVLDAPSQDAAAAIINVNASREALRASEARAAGLRLVADAAARSAAATEGDSSAARAYAVAAAAATEEEERRANALRKQLGVLEQVEGQLGKQTQAQARSTAATGAQRAGMQQLSFQLNDVAVGFAAGTPPMVIFAQQSGQVVQALQLMSGGAKGVLGILAGPWGLVFTTALIVLTPLVGKLIEQGKSLDDVAEKMRKDTEETEINRLGKERYSRTLDGVIARIRKQAKELEDQDRRGLTSGERENIDAKNIAQDALDIATKKVANLRATREALVRDLQDTTSPDANRQRRVQNLQANLTSLDAKIDKAVAAAAAAEQNLQKTRADLAEEEAKRAVDPIAQINRQYDERVKRAKADAVAEGHVTEELTRQLTVIEKQRAAAIKAAQEQKSQSGNRQSGRDITIAEAVEIVQGIGGHVTSASRSRAEQQVLYDRYLAGQGPLAAKPGTSAHEVGQAVDIAKGKGISLASIRKAFEDRGVRLNQLLDEGSHFHAAFGKKGPDADQLQRKADELARKQLDADQAFVQSKARAQEEQLRLARAAVNNVSEAADLDVRAVRIEQERLDALAKDRADETKAFDKNAEKRATELQALNADIAEKKIEAIRRRETSALLAEKLDQDRAEFDNAIEVLQLQGGLADTLSERRRIALQILELQEEELRREQRRILDDPLSSDAQRKRAQTMLDGIEAEGALRRKQTERQTESPAERLARDLNADTITEQIEQIKVKGLQELEDGLIGVIEGTESVSDAFKKMASSIISQLLRIAVQQAIIKPIASAIFPNLKHSAGGVVEGLATGGLIRGAGTATSDSILSWLSDGEFVMNAASTKRFLPLLMAMNDNRVPGFADGGPVGAIPRLPSIPRLESRPGRMTVDIDLKNDLLTARVRQTATEVAVPIAQAFGQRAVIGGAALAKESSQKASSRRLGRW